MIISLTRYTARLALRIRNTLDFAQTNDWKNLQLLIMPPEPRRGCHVGGSPWYLHGCWPFHPTDIDVANPWVPDFPTIAIDAFDADEEGRIVFLLDDRVYALPNGRYIGIVRMHQHAQPINIPSEGMQAVFQLHGAASYYDKGRLSSCEELCQPKPALLTPRPACDLVKFDIDLGPECAQHMVDQVVVEFPRASCGDDIEFCPSC